MKAIVNRFGTFLKSEDGPTATEYAVMLALIIGVAIASIAAFGSKVSGLFSTIESNV